MKAPLLHVFFFTALFFCNPSHALSVVFINPGFAHPNPTGDFWLNTTRFMQAAADDLNVELTTFYANRDHIYMKTLLQKAIQLKPDYLILVNEKNVGLSMLKMAEQAKIPSLFLLNGIDDEQWYKHKKNTSSTDYFLGSIEPDNYQAGFKLAQAMLEQISTTNGSIKALALLGDYITPASLARTKGMQAAFESKVDLLASETANWSAQKSERITAAWLKRVPDIQLIWAANDPMAFGASLAVEKNLSKTHQIVVGGINWDEKPVYGEKVRSLGGHVTLGGYAIVYLNDLSKRLIQSHQNKQLLDIFTDETKQCSKDIINLINNNEIGRIDFSAFSLAHHSTKNYTVENLALQIQPKAD